MKRLFLVMPLVLIIAACNQAAAPGDPSVITSRSAAWEAALNAKDVDGVAALYTSDARLMPPNLEMSTGLDGVRAAFGGMIDAGLSVKLVTVEASVTGNTGYRIGTYELMSGDDVVDVGKYIETWQRGDDGKWRIANDIWNSDRPPVPMQGQKKRERKHKGMGMAHLMILHEVKDAEHWLAAWTGEDSRRDLFKANGAMGVHTFQSADNPNLTGLVIGVKDMEALHAMLSSEEGQAAAAEDGVIAESMQVLTEKK